MPDDSSTFSDLCIDTKIKMDFLFPKNQTWNHLQINLFIRPLTKTSTIHFLATLWMALMDGIGLITLGDWDLGMLLMTFLSLLPTEVTGFGMNSIQILGK